MPKVELKHR